MMRFDAADDEHDTGTFVRVHRQNYLQEEQIMQNEWFTRPRRIAGVMTGTSLDAVDVAFADFSLEDGRPRMRSVRGFSSPFSEEERRGLQSLIRQPQRIGVVNDYNVWLSHRIASVVRAGCDEMGIAPSSLDAVGMHGQTVWHEPAEHTVHGIPLRSTLQIGSIPTLAVMVGTTVVGDFRSADVALGGQGAPLVPRFDADFLKDDGQEVIALNIGGMANVTLLPRGCSDHHVRAFDTGPGNVWIDHAMEQWFGKRYDDNGGCAREGTLHRELFERLCAIDFVTAPPPKSTGRETFSAERIDDLVSSCSSKPTPCDAVHTITAFTAWSIAENVRRYGWEDARIVVSGGGLRNAFLMERLGRELPAARIMSADSAGIPAEWKECLCFAYLAYRTLGGLPSNLPSVTGASRSTILGVVGYPGT